MNLNLRSTLLASAIGAGMILGAGTANALISVEPDAFAAGTDISNAYSGVTLSSIGLGFDGDSDASIFAIDSASQALEPFTASTVRLVFGTNDATFPHLFAGTGAASLRVDFASDVHKVFLDAISNNGADAGTLRAFDSLDNLLATYTTASMTANVFETMVVTAAGQQIAYVTASQRGI